MSSPLHETFNKQILLQLIYLLTRNLRGRCKGTTCSNMSNCCQMSQRVAIVGHFCEMWQRRHTFIHENVNYLVLIWEINDRKSLGRLTSQWASFRVKDGPVILF
jgi:hypothetical protein